MLEMTDEELCQIEGIGPKTAEKIREAAAAAKVDWDRRDAEEAARLEAERLAAEDEAARLAEEQAAAERRPWPRSRRPRRPGGRGGARPRRPRRKRSRREAGGGSGDRAAAGQVVAEGEGGEPDGER